MSGKPTQMSTIKQLMLMHQQGASNRNIAISLGLDKETVNRYIHKIRTHDMGIDELLALDAPILESKFMVGNAAYKDQRFEEFRELIPYFEKELSRKHVTRKILWEEYLGTHPDGYRYTQFCFHLNQMRVARKPTAVLEHHPGEKLYIDFAGDTMPYINKETGEVKQTQVFVATLPYSNYTFLMALPSQKSEDFLHGLSCALAYFDGTPKIVVPDNLKSAVTKSDKYEPDINHLLEDFANHYGFVVCPARVRKPRDKAAVENSSIAVHPRVQGFGYTIQSEHLCSTHLHYQKRSPYYYIQTAERRSVVLEKLIRLIFENAQTPETVYRRCDGLLNLQRKTDPLIFDRACQRAINNNVLTYKFVENIIKNRTYLENEIDFQENETPLPKHENIRGGTQACKRGYSVYYCNLQKLMARLKIARLEGNAMAVYEKLAKTDLLILDDFGLFALENQQQLDFMEIIEDRHARKATIIASQLPVANWFDIFKEETLADAILDRIAHTSHRIELKGESLRKKNSFAPSSLSS